MYLLEILILSSDSKEVIYIRRPCVWICTICMFLLVWFHATHMQEQWQKNYPYEALLTKNNDKINACIKGIYYRAESTDSSNRLYLKKVSVHISGQKVYNFSNMIVYSDQTSSLIPGNTIQCFGTLKNFATASNPGEFDQKQYYRELNFYYQLYADQIEVVSGHSNILFTKLDEIRHQLSTSIESGLPDKQAGIMQAVLLGQKTELPSDIKQLYQQNGIGHLLAISGLHVTIFCFGIFRLLLICRLPRRISILATISFLISYGLMTGFSISTSRAVIMMLLLFAADLLHRSYDLLSSLAISACIITLQNPYAIYSCSFLLSYFAVLGIAAILPALQMIIVGDSEKRRAKLRKKRRWIREKQQGTLLDKCQCKLSLLLEKTAQSLLASAAIQLTTLPIVLFFFYEIPVYGIFLNLLVLPLVSYLVLIGGVACILGLWLPFVSHFLFGTTYCILSFYEYLCRLFQRLPIHSLILGQPQISRIVIYYIILALSLLWINKRTIIKLYPLLIWTAAVILLLFPIPRKYFKAVFLDVGQGDGILLQHTDGTTFLIDGGSTSKNNIGEYCLIPYLKSQGIHCIDYMIMTHADKDHISGQLELMKHVADRQDIQIRKLLLPLPSQEMQSKEGYRQMITAAKQADIPIQTICAGDHLQKGALSVACLHPKPFFDASSANAYSTTIEVTYYSTKMLLCGDLEGDGEQYVLEQLKRSGTRFNILKVAHHGSKNSTSAEFLAQVQPQYAIISCGKNNRYGHPHRELLSRLNSISAHILSTTEQGAVTVYAGRDSVSILGYFDKNK